MRWSAFRFSRVPSCLLFAACAVLLLSPAELTAQTAHFSYAQTSIVSGYAPYGVARDSSGNLYIADADSAQVHKYAPNGHGGYTQQANVASSGLVHPAGVAVDAGGNVYVADSGMPGSNPGAVYQYAPDGHGGYSRAGMVGNGSLANPSGVAVDLSGDVYIADTFNQRVVRVLATDLTCATPGDCIVVGGGLSGFPFGLTIDNSGSVYVTDTSGAVHKYAPNGSGGYAQQSDVASGLTAPWGVAVDNQGNVYVTDTVANVVDKYAPNGSGGYAAAGVVICNLNGPWGMAADNQGSLYITDTNNSRVLKLQTAGVNFQSVPVKQNGDAQTVTFTFDSAGAMGQPPSVLTRGALNRGFKDAGTGSCKAGQSYNAGDACTVDVTFSPMITGPRYGAVVLHNSTGAPMATAYIHGMALGPQLAFGPPAQSIAVGTGLSSPTGVAVDGNGNVYIADTKNGAVHKYSSSSGGGYIPLGDIANGLGYPVGVAVDGSGNVYVADAANNAVHRYAPNGSGSYNPLTDVAANGLKGPTGVVVDGSGNVYIADTSNGAVHKYAPNGSGGYAQLADVASGLNGPTGIAIDSTRNVYVAETFRNAVHKYAPNGSGGYTQLADVAASGLYLPTSVAVDAGGNVYIVDTNNLGTLHKYAPDGSGGYTPVANVIDTGLNGPYGTAVDSSGNIYLTDTNNNRVLKEDVSDPPSLNFPQTAIGSTSAQTLTISNIGNQDLIFPAPATGSNPSVAEGFSLGASSTCPQVSSSATPGALPAGSSCSLVVEFAPTAAGAVNAPIMLTDNALNAAPPSYATQSINLTGSGSKATQTITFTSPGSTTYGTGPLALSATASSGLTVTFSVVSGPAAIHGNTLTITGAGTVVVSADQSGDSSYDQAPQVTQTIHVSPASLVVTANDATRIYGTANPSFTYQISGLVNGDTAAAITGAAVLSTTATSSSPAGQYAIMASPGTLSAANYVFVYQAGWLTISPATTTVSWAAPADIVYGAALSPAQLNASSSGVAGSFSYSPPLGTVLAAGTHTLSATFTPTDKTDHSTPQTATVTLKVAAATLTVTALNAARVYGAANPALSGTVAGAVNNDSFTATYATTANASSNAGTYSITPAVTGAGLGNYSVNYVNGTLTVTKADAAITLAASADASFSGQSISFTANVVSATTGAPTGSVNFYDGGTLLGTATLSGGHASFTTSALGVGTHTITAAYSGDGNFNPAIASSGTAITIASSDFTLSGTSGSIQTVDAGKAATFSFSVAPAAGAFVAPVSFSVSGLPPGATASFSPSSFAANSVGGQVQMTIQTAKSSTTAMLRASSGIALALLLFPFMGIRRARRRAGLLLAVLLVAGVAGLSGCGISMGSNNGGSTPPVADYDLTVTATSRIVRHTMVFTIRVQQ